jgi:hypothetical protein
MRSFANGRRESCGEERGGEEKRVGADDRSVGSTCKEGVKH